MNLSLQFSQSDTRFTGFYRGKVVNNQDPMKSGRVQVLVYPMFADLPETQYDLLPWAVPAFSLSFGASSQAGTFTVPSVGSEVWVFFENGDYQTPVYFAEAYTPKDNKSILQEHYPKRHGIRSEANTVAYIDDEEKSAVIELDNGNKIKLTSSENYILLEHSSGAIIKLENGGAIHIATPATIYFSASTIQVEGSGDLHALIQGNVEISSTETIRLSAPSIQLN